MTNEEAIRTMEYFDRNFGDYKPNHEAIQMAIQALFAQSEPKRIPCDLCQFNPPSAMDGKPCTMCSAQGREGGSNG